MNNSVSILRATAADSYHALFLLERFFAEEGFETKVGQIRVELAHLLNDDGCAVFLALLDRRAVGIATVTTTRGIELGLSAELEDLYVLPEAREQGVAAALIDAVKDWCRFQGCSLVAVIVTPQGQATHHLIEYYCRRGFEETGRTVLFAHLKQ